MPGCALLKFQERNIWVSEKSLHPPLQNEQERLRKETLPLTLSTRNSEGKGKALALLLGITESQAHSFREAMVLGAYREGASL